MKKTLLRSLILLFIVCLNGQLIAQIPTGYYTSAEGKSKAELKTALYNIIKTARVLSYGSGSSSTWSGFIKTDIRPEDGTVWDMYSNNHVNFNGTSAASGMNIEHALANSWWGGTKNQTYNDLFNLNPSDITANSAKGSYPMAVVDGTKTFDNGVIKVGVSSSRPGGFITAWEPADEYKGDFARGYMYMVTCYENLSSIWTGNSVNQLDNNTYPVFEPWAYNLLLKWCKDDPVSQKEINRNNEVYKIQGNRNPFIDYPELVDYVWGTKTDTLWYLSSGTDPILYSPSNNSTLDLGAVAINSTLEKEVSVTGKNFTGDISVAVSGTGFSVNVSALSKEQVLAGAKVLVQYTSATAAASTGQLTLSGDGVTVTVNLKAEAVDKIPVLSAENITSGSFVAKWKNICVSSSYQFSLYNSDKTTLVDGYPITVDAATEKQTITGLTPETVYYYQIVGGGLSSLLTEIKTDVKSSSTVTNFFEDFEKGTKGSYSTTDLVNATMGSWTFNNSLIMGTDVKDLKNGNQSARLGKYVGASVSMNADKADGAGTLSFYAGTYGTDAAVTFGVYYSIDGGSNWVTVDNNVSATSTFTKYTYTLNVSSPVRIKISNIGGTSRVNVDDVSITANASTGISGNEIAPISFFVQGNQLIIQNSMTQNIQVSGISGQVLYSQKLMPGVTSVTLPKGIYILKGENLTKKVLIK